MGLRCGRDSSFYLAVIVSYVKLLAIGSPAWAQAQQHEFNASTLPHLQVPIGRQHIDHGEWEPFLRTNLVPDLEHWRRRAPLRPADIFETHNKTQTVLPGAAVMQLVLIYNNKLYWPLRPDPNGGDPNSGWASPYNIEFHKRLVPALASGKVHLPNVLFIYNTDDNTRRINGPHRNLSVPLLSIIKSLGLEKGDDLDILVPQFSMLQTSTFSVPWHIKRDRAFFRGTGFCSHQWKVRYAAPDACARLYLSQLSLRDEMHGNSTALDCGLVEEYPEALYYKTPDATITMKLPVKPRVPFAHHAAYKWLLHLEGYTASNRLGQLMLVNSLVLVQRSNWYEYFYRSLRPWVHYVPFWNATSPDGRPLGMDDVYGTLDELRRLDREQPEAVQRIIATANNFAVKYLTPYARMLYLQAALTEYKSLFPDMDAFLETYVAELRSKGWNIS